MAQGRVWLGSQAPKHGLVDEVGGFGAALEHVLGKAGLSRHDPIQLVFLPRSSALEQVLASAGMQANTSVHEARTTGAPTLDFGLGGLLTTLLTASGYGQGSPLPLPDSIRDALRLLVSTFSSDGQPLARLPFEIRFE